MLDDPNDTNINAEGYHTREKHCGAKQTPAFYIAETYDLIGTNGYDIEACNETPNRKSDSLFGTSFRYCRNLLYK